MSFEIKREKDGSYTIRDVPIFKTHSDRGFECNEEWMRDAIRNHQKFKEMGYRPMIIIGHNQKGTEKKAVGFLDNLRFDPQSGILHADLVKLPEALVNEIKQNAWPNRSVEILPKSRRILALALLGGTTSHFALPQMVYERGGEQSRWRSSPRLIEEEELVCYGGPPSPPTLRDFLFVQTTAACRGLIRK